MRRKKDMLTRTSIAAVALAAFLGVGTAANAAPIAYEGFNYSSGAVLDAASGGTGWGLNWSKTSVIGGTTAASSLSYTDSSSNSLSTSGGSAVFGPSNPASTLVYMRQLSSTLGASAVSGTVWASLLYLNASTSTTAEARFGFYSAVVADSTATTNTATGGATQVVDVGRAASGSDVISLYNGSTINSTGVATPRGSSADFLLLKFALNGTSAADTVSLWVNPSLSGGEAGLGSAQATWNTSDLDPINGIRLQTPATSGIVDIDEIRVGTTLADVAPVPEPSMTLAALGGMAFLFLKRARD
jgi:hypothetical protein